MSGGRLSPSHGSQTQLGRARTGGARCGAERAGPAGSKGVHLRYCGRWVAAGRATAKKQALMKTCAWTTVGLPPIGHLGLRTRRFAQANQVQQLHGMLAEFQAACAASRIPSPHLVPRPSRLVCKDARPPWLRPVSPSSSALPCDLSFSEPLGCHWWEPPPVACQRYSALPL